MNNINDSNIPFYYQEKRALLLQSKSVSDILIEELEVPITKTGLTLLLQAVVCGNIERVQDLIKVGANLHAKNYHGQNCLMLACQHGLDWLLVELLLELGMKEDIGMRSNAGLLCIHYAGIAGNTSVIIKLIELGMDPGLCDYNGMSVLHHTLNCGHNEAALMLCKLNTRSDERNIYMGKLL